MIARKARVVVTHWLHPEVGDYLAGFCDAVTPARDEGVWLKPRLAELVADADGLMAFMADSIDEAFLASCRRLRVVSATLRGYDNFDAEACTRRGAWITIVLPLTSQTRHLVDAPLLQRLRPGAFLVAAGHARRPAAPRPRRGLAVWTADGGRWAPRQARWTYS